MARSRSSRGEGPDARRLAEIVRRGAERLGRRVRRGPLATWSTARVDATRTVLRVLRRADVAMRYRLPVVSTAHLLAIAELRDRGALDDAIEAAEGVERDLLALDRKGCGVALRARAERAKALAGHDRGDDAVGLLTGILRDLSRFSPRPAGFELAVRLDLAVLRRELGDVVTSTDELRALVPAVADEFGDASSWLITTVAELATNVALGGQLSTAVEMVAALLPRATTRHGPLSHEALALRSRMARWTIADDEGAATGERLCAEAIVDFTRAGRSTCAEACELRYVLADAHFARGDVDYAIAQLVSLRDDLDGSSWCSSSFADAVRSDLTDWCDARDAR